MDFAENYFQELYYVAYYRGECVGVLYATFYKRRGKNDARAVIATLVVAKDKERCAGKIVAAELLERLKADTRADDCQRYFVEIPRLEELTRKQRDICREGGGRSIRILESKSFRTSRTKVRTSGSGTT